MVAESQVPHSPANVEDNFAQFEGQPDGSSVSLLLNVRSQPPQLQ